MFRFTRLVTLIAIALLGLCGTALANPSQTMIYGPHQMMTFDAKSPKGNLAYKGAVIKLSDENGGAYVCFDTELFRYAAGWAGGFINYEGVSYKGDHGKNPGPAGTVQFTTSAAPGIADPQGKFDDTRANKPYGNLPREWARYHGLYHHDGKVILSYSAGDSAILEMPSISNHDGVHVFARQIKIGKGKAVTIVLVEAEGEGKADDKMATIEKGDRITAAGFFMNSGAKLRTQGQRILLDVPARNSDVQLVVKFASFAKADQGKFEASLQGAERVRLADVSAWTKGGPRQWTEEVTTKGTLGDTDAKAKSAPYVVDTITVPFNNAYKSWMRTGGFDFFKDGTTAAVTTWNGDVWIVKGIDDKLDNVTWSRFAAGLHDGLGLKIVDEVIYVHGRDGITRLHDLNKDGQADFYENFNNDIIITFGFHEFAYELHTDKAGNFYFVKGGAVNPGGSGWQAITPHHGCAFKLSKDGSKLEVIATGLRAPNGMAVGPNGEITTGDNEGTWVPKSRINYWTADELAKRKGFGGVVDLSHMDPKPTIYDAPICWMPKNVCNSGGGQAWVTSDKWGPFTGDLLYASYGTCSLFKVLKEEVDGPDGKTVQGGVVRFPLKFDSGTCRLRFNDRDGQLYVMGIKGWQSSAARDGSFQRVRYTGKPVNMPAALKAGKNGLTLTFTGKLSKELAEDVDSYQIQQWNYRWTSAYGSDHWKVSNPAEKGADKVAVKSAKLLDDGKSVFLEIQGLQPVMQMHVKYALETPEGEEIKGEIYNTINKVGADAALASQ